MPERTPPLSSDSGAGHWRFDVMPEDDAGHTWERAYYDGHLVGMRCKTCRREPLEVLEAHKLSQCRGTISAIMKGFNL